MVLQNYWLTLIVLIAAGPDKIPNQVLKYAANGIAPYLHAIFRQSLTTGELPEDWVEAYFSHLCVRETYPSVRS